MYHEMVILNHKICENIHAKESEPENVKRRTKEEIELAKELAEKMGACFFTKDELEELRIKEEQRLQQSLSEKQFA